MNKRPAYSIIDMESTGRKLKNMLESTGYTSCMILVVYYDKICRKVA